MHVENRIISFPLNIPSRWRPNIRAFDVLIGRTEGDHIFKLPLILLNDILKVPLILLNEKSASARVTWRPHQNLHWGKITCSRGKWLHSYRQYIWRVIFFRLPLRVSKTTSACLKGLQELLTCTLLGIAPGHSLTPSVVQLTFFGSVRIETLLTCGTQRCG